MDLNVYVDTAQKTLNVSIRGSERGCGFTSPVSSRELYLLGKELIGVAEMMMVEDEREAEALRELERRG